MFLEYQKARVDPITLFRSLHLPLRPARQNASKEPLNRPSLSAKQVSPFAFDFFPYGGISVGVLLS
jgi:hypothetical protein